MKYFRQSKRYKLEKCNRHPGTPYCLSIVESSLCILPMHSPYLSLRAKPFYNSHCLPSYDTSWCHHANWNPSSITTQIPKKWASTNCHSKVCFSLSNTTHTLIAKCSQLSIHCLPVFHAVLFAQLCGTGCCNILHLPALTILPLPIEGTAAGRVPSSWFLCAFPSCSCPVAIDL